jgi:hypothetical protein
VASLAAGLSFEERGGDRTPAGAHGLRPEYRHGRFSHWAPSVIEITEARDSRGYVWAAPF